MADIRFCTARDGARLAYSMHGRGPPLVRVATWLTHLELDWQSPVWRHWLERLGERRTVLRYDERGCGLSDAEVGEPSVETWVGDLEAVVDAARLERFALLGVSQGAAIAVAYAARHPDRVSDLVLYGGYARGRQLRGQRAEEEALVAAIRAGWTSQDPSFRHLFSMLFLPHGTPEQMAWYDDLLRKTTSADAAIRLFRARGLVDVVADRFDGGRPDARPPRARRSRGARRRRAGSSPPASPAPAWSCSIPRTTSCSRTSRPGSTFLAELDDFLGPADAIAPSAALAELSPRELRGARARRGGTDQRGDRAAARPEHPHGRAPPVERLREARCLGHRCPRRRGGRLHRAAAEPDSRPRPHEGRG